MVRFGLPAFGDTSSLGYPLRWVPYHPSGSILVITSCFLAGNREAELKLTTFSSLVLFSVFLSLFFS